MDSRRLLITTALITVVDDELSETCFNLNDLTQVSKANKWIPSPDGGEPSYVRTVTICAGGPVELIYTTDDARDEIYDSLKAELRRKHLRAAGC